MAWYRQYRPKKISELNIVLVKESLEKMMKSGKIPQTLLFAGPKGTGKTSTSRIIGALLNDPQNEDLVEELYFKGKKSKNRSFQEPDADRDFARKVYQGHSFVVQELDAASNRRIDDIRQLKDRINLPPQEGKMTVYILDEVHMLTNEAFNALLKILEEPPAHVVFILATTELHKIPDTIKSRCTMIRFQKASETELVAALERILDAEKINYKKEDLILIAKRADGSFRDAVKILEQACQSGKFDLEVIENILASKNEQQILALLEAVMAKDEVKVINIFEELRAANTNQKDFYKDCFSFLHHDLMINLGIKEGAASFSAKIDQFFLKELIAADLNQETPIDFLVLELKLLEIIERSKKGGTGDNGKKKLKSEPELLKKNEKKLKTNSFEEKITNSPEKIEKSQPFIEEKTEVIATIDTESISKVEDQSKIWSEMINFLKNENFSLATLLKSCKLDCVDKGIAKVLVYYSFHKEQLEQNKNVDILEKIIAKMTGRAVKFEFVLNTDFEKDSYDEEDLVLMAKDALV